MIKENTERVTSVLSVVVTKIIINFFMVLTIFVKVQLTINSQILDFTYRY